MSRIVFDADFCGDWLLKQSSLSWEDKSSHGWNHYDGTAMHYTYKDHNYRTWKHQVSACRKDAAILVSCKIDNRHWKGGKDDHLILMASVNRFQSTIAVQAAVQTFKHSNTCHSPVVVNDQKSDTGTRFETAAKDAIKTMLGRSSDEGLENMADVATLNLRALALSVFVR